jgi:hypothetical protein
MSTNVWADLEPEVESRSTVGERLYRAPHGDCSGDRNPRNLGCESTFNVFCVGAVECFAPWKERGNRRWILTRLKELRNASVQRAGTVEFGHRALQLLRLLATLVHDQ